MPKKLFHYKHQLLFKEIIPVYIENHMKPLNAGRISSLLEWGMVLNRLCIFYFIYEAARKCCRKFKCNFRGEWVLCRHSVHYLLHTLKTSGSLLDKKPDKKLSMLTEETLHDVGAGLESSARKFLKWLQQDRGVSRKSAQRATKTLKVQPYKALVVHTLKEHDIVVRIHFCKWFLWSCHLSKGN